jgi:hypothetical protein
MGACAGYPFASGGGETCIIEDGRAVPGPIID